MLKNRKKWFHKVKLNKNSDTNMRIKELWRSTQERYTEQNTEKVVLSTENAKYWKNQLGITWLGWKIYAIKTELERYMNSVKMAKMQNKHLFYYIDLFCFIKHWIEVCKYPYSHEIMWKNKYYLILICFKYSIINYFIV